MNEWTQPDNQKKNLKKKEFKKKENQKFKLKKKKKKKQFSPFLMARKWPTLNIHP